MTNEEAIETLSYMRCEYNCFDEGRRRYHALSMAIESLKQTQWIPCEERLPKKPKPNDKFEGKPLDIYLVCKKGNIPFRAVWNGKNFADGWSTLDVDAWMPLPKPYEGANRMTISTFRFIVHSFQMFVLGFQIATLIWVLMAYKKRK